MAELSTKPYLLRAIYEWCADNGYTPYIAVAVDERTQVPREYVRNGEIVLNVSGTATNRLVIGNERVEFQARFGGVPRELSIPVDQVSAIYARENGHGMAFDVPKALAVVEPAAEGSPPREAEPDRTAPRRSGPVPLAAVPPSQTGLPARAADPSVTAPEAGEATVPTLVGSPSGHDAADDHDETRSGSKDPGAPPPSDSAPGQPPDGGPEPGPGKPGRPRLTRIK